MSTTITRLITADEEAALAARGVVIDWDGRAAVEDPTATVTATTRRRKTPAPGAPEAPTRVVRIPDGPPEAAVMAFDPASGKSGRDAFGRAVVLAYPEVAVVIDAGVMPRTGTDRKPVTQREHAGLALALHTQLRQRLAELGASSAPVWIIADNKGSGVAFVEALRELGGPELARRSIIGFEASGQSKGRRWPPAREEKTRHLSWVVSTSWVVESTNHALEAGRLVVAPNVPDLAELLDERSRYRARTLPSGRIRFAAGGRGHDDRLSAVLMGALVARNCVRPRPPVVTADVLVAQMAGTIV
jgi:hypothetical protein